MAEILTLSFDVTIPCKKPNSIMSPICYCLDVKEELTVLNESPHF